jgi:hypothetical protein
MEDLLVLMIQGGAEFFSLILNENFFSSILDSLVDWPNLSPSGRTAWICFFLLLLGLAIGGLSVDVFHHLFLHWSSARLLLFATGPFLAGAIPAGCLYLLTAHRQLTCCCFLFIAFFIFGINIARFGYCERPPAYSEAR